MKYPENERILVVRPCLKTICLGVKPAAKLLSALLYQARNCPDEEPSFTIQWTQEQVIKAVCEEFTSKTLHDTAIPCLELLGYLDVDTSSYVYQYILHLDLIHRALEVYSTPVELEKFLIVCIRSQLEKVLNELEKLPNQLEEVLIQLEKLLIVIRKTSNSKRGRKARTQAPLEAISENPRLLEIDKITERGEESTGEQTNTATFASSLSLDALTPSQSNEIHSQQGDIHGTILPTGHADLHRPLELHRIDGTTQGTLGDPHGITSTQQQEVTPKIGEPAHATTPLDRPPSMAADQPILPGEAIVAHESGVALDLEASHGVQPAPERVVPDANPAIDLDFCNAETEHRLPAIPKTLSLPPAVEPGHAPGSTTPVAPATLPGLTSHEQNRDVPPGIAVEDSGGSTPAPAPQVLPGVSPPRTMRATVVSPPPQVLVVSQQFSSVEDWKQAQEAFIEQLRGIWKTAGADFKRQSGNWNVYRKQYLDRWLKANPEPAEVQFTPDGKTLFDEWCSLFKVKVDAGKANIEAANWLSERLTLWVEVLNLSRAEVLRDFKAWLYANDKKGYFNRGVKLFDLRREFEGWQSYQQSLLDKAEREKSRPQNKYGTVSGLPRLEIDPEWLEAMEGR